MGRRGRSSKRSPTGAFNYSGAEEPRGSLARNYAKKEMFGASKDLARSLRVLFWLVVDTLLLLGFALFLGAGVPYVLMRVYGTADPFQIAVIIAKWMVPVMVLLLGVVAVFYVFRRIMRGR